MGGTDLSWYGSLDLLACVNFETEPDRCVAVHLSQKRRKTAAEEAQCEDADGHIAFVVTDGALLWYFLTVTREVSAHFHVTSGWHRCRHHSGAQKSFLVRQFQYLKRKLRRPSFFCATCKCSTQLAGSAENTAFGTTATRCRRAMTCRLQKLLLINISLLRVQKRPRCLYREIRTSKRGLRIEML